MRRDEPAILGFRRRLMQAIDAQCDGKYTVLARRAQIPVSTLEHYLHDAKHLPGGEHILRMADALGVPVQVLMTENPTARVTDHTVLRQPMVFPLEGDPVLGIARHLLLPVFRCGCPGPCPLTAEVPATASRHTTIVLEAALLARHDDHRLLAVLVDPRLPCAEWPLGARLAVDQDARTPQWAALTLLHTTDRCRLGHVMPAGDRLVFASQMDGTPELVSRESRVLGTIVAGVMSL